LIETRAAHRAMRLFRVLRAIKRRSVRSVQLEHRRNATP